MDIYDPQFLLDQILNLKFLDPLTVALSLICTYYSITANIKTWPIGILASSIDIYLYFQSGLYADMATSIIWIIMFSYGWRQWQNNQNDQPELRIRWLETPHFAMLLGGLTVCTFLVAFLLMTYTNSKVPCLDAFTAVFSIGAQWLMCRKYIQTWLIWFVVDSCYVHLYFKKDLVWHSVLLFAYVFLAIAGLIRWYYMLNKHKQLSQSPILS